MQIARNYAHARQSCGIGVTGSKTADVVTCCCLPVSNLSAHALYLPIPATSLSRISRSSSNCHRSVTRRRGRGSRRRSANGCETEVLHLQALAFWPCSQAFLVWLPISNERKP